MKVVLKLQENINNLMRRCGYFFIKEEKGEAIFARPLSLAGSGYPRFHIYATVSDVSRETVLNLHLDQKKPIYPGAAAHAGEYEGEVVEKEAARIKQMLGPMVQR